MAVPPKNIALLCNPYHQKAIAVTDKIAALLQTKKITFSIFTTYWPTVWDGFTEAWIVGGDGTVNYFINQYPNIHLPLAVFAGGTGNDFYWMLYGKTKLFDQVTTILKAHAHPVDAGLCNGRLFLNGVGIGFDGAVVQQLVGRKKRFGKATYLLTVLKNIFRYKAENCTLLYNGMVDTRDCFMISIANGKRYGGGFMVAPGADVNDGVLELMTVGKIAPLKRLRYLPAIEKGKHLHLPFIQYQQLNNIIIRTAKNLPAHIDGEYFSSDIFEIKCLEKRFSFLW